jgi:hypothetical protein
MAYLWKHRKERGAGQGYAKAAGGYATDYLPKSIEQLAQFCRALKMQQAKVANTNHVEHLLQQSPLVIWRHATHISHIMLLTGYSDRNWYYLDPQVCNKGDATQHTFGEHSYNAITHTHSQNTVITRSGVKMNDKQASWHAELQHQAKDHLFAQLRKVVFGYFDPKQATGGKLTHV